MKKGEISRRATFQNPNCGGIEKEIPVRMENISPILKNSLDKHFGLSYNKY